MNLKANILAATLIFLSPTSLAAEPLIRVMVIDSGANLKDKRLEGVICPENYDLVGEDIPDSTKHGHHIMGIIRGLAGNKGYCMSMCRFYSPLDTPSAATEKEIDCIEKAVNGAYSIVNISAGGMSPSDRERHLIASHPEVKFIVAAGNDGASLNKPENHYYPASYVLDNITVVGSLDKTGDHAITSNFGNRVQSWQPGVDIPSLDPDGKSLLLMSGTSQATAVETGLYLRERLYLPSLGGWDDVYLFVATYWKL